MAKFNKYKTFAELKKPIKKTSVTKKRKEQMTLDLDKFVSKIKSSKVIPVQK